MKRFVWRLQRILDIKTKEEQTKKAELLKVTEKLTQSRSELVTQKRILDSILDGLAEVEPKKRIGKQEFFLKCSAQNDELIRKLKGKVSELESRQREKISEVLKVKRFKEALEKLRTEAKRRFEKEQEKLEQKEADEGATVAFARKTMKQDRSINRFG